MDDQIHRRTEPTEHKNELEIVSFGDLERCVKDRSGKYLTFPEGRDLVAFDRLKNYTIDMWGGDADILNEVFLRQLKAKIAVSTQMMGWEVEGLSLVDCWHKLTGEEVEWINPHGRNVIRQTPPRAPADTGVEDDNKSNSKGVALRDQWFFNQYKSEGTDTYHKPAIIEAKWNGMEQKDRANICPGSPNKVSRATVTKAIQKAKKNKQTKIPYSLKGR